MHFFPVIGRKKNIQRQFCSATFGTQWTCTSGLQYYLFLCWKLILPDYFKVCVLGCLKKKKKSIEIGQHKQSRIDQCPKCQKKCTILGLYGEYGVGDSVPFGMLFSSFETALLPKLKRPLQNSPGLGCHWQGCEGSDILCVNVDSVVLFMDEITCTRPTESFGPCS